MEPIPNWIGWDDLTALDVAERAEATDVVEWLRSVGAERRPRSAPSRVVIVRVCAEQDWGIGL